METPTSKPNPTGPQQRPPWQSPAQWAQPMRVADMSERPVKSAPPEALQRRLAEKMLLMRMAQPIVKKPLPPPPGQA